MVPRGGRRPCDSPRAPFMSSSGAGSSTCAGIPSALATIQRLSRFDLPMKTASPTEIHLLEEEPEPAEPLLLDPRAPTLRPFFGFYGGKWRDSRRLYPLPELPVLVEPFAGSAGYAVRYHYLEVVLCEVDPVIAAVWDYLINVKSSEILAIRDLGHDESVDDLTGVPQEARWLIGFWLNRGTDRPRRSPSKWMREGVRPGSFWGERVRQTLAFQVNHIRHWTIHNCAYDSCPYDGPATWFVDPPYQHAGRHYTYGSKLIDYEQLGLWCESRTGQTIVCENQGADWLPFVPLDSTKTTRAGRVSREVVWYGGTEGLAA